MSRLLLVLTLEVIILGTDLMNFSRGQFQPKADSMLCKVRHSHFEQPVNISVWRLNVMAPTKLCEVFLAPNVLFKLARQEENWRIAMHTCDNSAPHAHPWICFDIQLEDNVNFKNHYLSLPNSRASDDSVIAAPLSCIDSMRSTSLMNMSERHAGYHELKIRRENLFDQNMKKIIKNDKDTEDHRHANGRWMKRACLGSFFLLLVLLVPRFYIMSCYHQYQWLTVAQSMEAAAKTLTNSSFATAFQPKGGWEDKLEEFKGDDAIWTTPELHSLWKKCLLDTLGLSDQDLQTDPLLPYCRPKEKLVAETCFQHDKSKQPEPRAGKDVVDLLESNGGVGRIVVNQLRQVDSAIHASFPSSPQYFFTGGIHCPCEVLTFRDSLVLGFMPVHVLMDLLIWTLLVSIVVLRCWCMPHAICGIASMPGL